MTKIKKPNSKRTTEVFVTVGGVALGSKLSKGASAVLPIDDKTTAKAVLAGVGLATALFVDGDDILAQGIRAVGAGMAAQQSGEMLDDAVKDSLPKGDKKTDKFLQASFGQLPVSGGAGGALAGRRRLTRSRRRLGEPSVLRMGVAPTEASGTLLMG